MYQRYQLSHTDAMKIIAAIQAELEKENKGTAIAVADAQGELIAFLRTDGCRLPSINIAINKAFTAAREEKESKAVGQASKEENFPMTRCSSFLVVSGMERRGIPEMTGKDGFGNSVILHSRNNDIRGHSTKT